MATKRGAAVQLKLSPKPACLGKTTFSCNKGWSVKIGFTVLIACPPPTPIIVTDADSLLVVVFSDQERPQFVNCPGTRTSPQSLVIVKYDTLERYVPMVTDNSGSVSRVYADVSLNEPVAVARRVIWRAEDHAGNQATECVWDVTIKGKIERNT